MSNVLFLVQWIPYPPDKGDTTWSYYLPKYLQLIYEKLGRPNSKVNEAGRLYLKGRCDWEVSLGEYARKFDAKVCFSTALLTPVGGAAV